MIKIVVIFVEHVTVMYFKIRLGGLKSFSKIRANCAYDELFNHAIS